MGLAVGTQGAGGPVVLVLLTAPILGVLLLQPRCPAGSAALPGSFPFLGLSCTENTSVPSES